MEGMMQDRESLNNLKHKSNFKSTPIEPTSSLTNSINLSCFESFLIRRLQKLYKFDLHQSYDVVKQMRAIQAYYTKDANTYVHVSKSIYFSFYGFGCPQKRNLFLRALRYVTKARVIQCSYVSLSGSRFEGICYVNPFSKQNQEHKLEDLEDLMSLFSMSIGLFEFDRYMGPEMLSCFERIENGHLPYGNLKCQRNQKIYSCFLSMTRHRRMQESQMRVLNETGLEFTPQNMLRVYYDSRNAIIDNEVLQNAVITLTQTLNLLGMEEPVQTARIESARLLLFSDGNEPGLIDPAHLAQVNDALRAANTHQVSLRDEIMHSRTQIATMLSNNNINLRHPPLPDEGLPDTTSATSNATNATTITTTSPLLTRRMRIRIAPIPPPPPLAVNTTTIQID